MPPIMMRSMLCCHLIFCKYPKMPMVLAMQLMDVTEARENINSYTYIANIQATRRQTCALQRNWGLLCCMPLYGLTG